MLIDLGPASSERISVSKSKQTEHSNKNHNHRQHIKHRHSRHRHHQKHRHQTNPEVILPPESSPEETTNQQVAKCFADLATMELCQRCATVTKSENVFPLCCSDTDGVQGWCVEYLDYGQDKT